MSGIFVPGSISGYISRPNFHYMTCTCSLNKTQHTFSDSSLLLNPLQLE